MECKFNCYLKGLTDFRSRFLISCSYCKHAPPSVNVAPPTVNTAPPTVNMLLLL